MSGVKRCGLCWLVTAVLALLEAACLYQWIDGTLYVRKWGAAENPYAAEDAWMAGIFSLLAAVPLLVMLALAVYYTIKLRKRGKM